MRNKEAILSVAPLLIEPAPALLPIVVSLLSNPAIVQFPGVALVGLGGYELTQGNSAGVVLALLGAPLVAVGSLLGSQVSVPTVTPGSFAATPAAAVPNAEGTDLSVKVSTNGGARVASPNKMGGERNSKRRTIKINRY